MIINNWNPLTNYIKHNVIYRDNSLYYCLIPNTNVDPLINNINNTIENPIWSTNTSFYWRPSYDSSIENQVGFKRFESSEGLFNSQDFKANKNDIIINVKFDKLNDIEAAAILIFLENKKGNERFDFLAANPYNQKNKYTCKSFQHTWSFAQNNTISAIFERKF